MQQPGVSKVPRRTPGTSSRIVRTGNITNSIVVIGDNNQLSINREGNAIINPLAQNKRPKIRRRSSPVIVGRPSHSISLLDRDLERNTVQGAFQAGNCIEFYSAEGLGKTTLVRYLSSQLQLPDGMVVIDRAKPLEDLLQELFEAFYHSNQVYKPTQVEYKRRFENPQVLILLDNFSLTREDTQVLLDTLPNCVFVLASNERHLWGRGNAIKLAGLPLKEALALLQQQIGRQLTRAELPVAQSICTALQGHPLQIIQIAALVHDEGRSLREAARQIAGTNPQERITERALANLPDDTKGVLALLATFRNAPLPVEHLTEILQNAKPGPLLRKLLNRGLVKAHSPSYSLTGNLGSYINKNWDLSQWNETSLRHFASWTARSNSMEQILDSAQALMATIENAVAMNRWQAVIQIGLAIEPNFVTGLRWGLWEQLLSLLIQAAQALGDRAIEAWALHQLGSRALCLGNLQEARELLSRALQMRQAIGDRSGAAATLHNLRQIPGGPPPHNPSGPRGGPSSFKGWIIPLTTLAIIITTMVVSARGNPRIELPSRFDTDTATSAPARAQISTQPQTSTPLPSRTATTSRTPSRTVTPSRRPSITVSPIIPLSGGPSLTFFQNANCRSGPGTVYRPVTSFNQGETVDIKGQNGGDPRWWFVAIPDSFNSKCWVSDVTGSTTGLLDGVPVVVVAQPTTPTPTESIPPAPPTTITPTVWVPPAPPTTVTVWVPVPPTAPTGFNVYLDPYYCWVTLSWNDVSGEDGYRVYRDGSFLGALSANTTSYIERPGYNVSRSYYVQAFNAAGFANSDVKSTNTCVYVTDTPDIYIPPR